MGELNIQIKVLKEKAPIFFTWWNQTSNNTEGCLITCRCQGLGVSNGPVSSGHKMMRRNEIWRKNWSVGLCEALENAEIISLPPECNSLSVLDVFGSEDTVDMESWWLGQSGKGNQSDEVNAMNETANESKAGLEDSISIATRGKAVELALNIIADDEPRVAVKGISSLGGRLFNEGSITELEDESISERQKDCRNSLPELAGIQEVKDGVLGNVPMISENLDGKILSVSSLSGDTLVMEEVKAPMSEIDSALYGLLLKGIINSSPEDVKETKNLCSASNLNEFPEVNNVDLFQHLDPISNLPVDPVAVVNTPAMVKYRKHKNDEFLKKLHKTYNQKHVSTVICEYCGAVITNKTLSNHFKAHHSADDRERKFACLECDKKFLTSSNLKRHTITHFDATVKCRFCDRKFKLGYACKAHEKAHHGHGQQASVRKPKYKTTNPKTRKPKAKQKGEGKVKLKPSKERRFEKIPCSTCGQVVQRRSMRVHMNIHSVKTFTCHICEKTVRFYSKYQHLNTHNVKRFSCSLCEHRVHTKSALAMHMKKHTKEFSIPCRICGQMFLRYQTRLDHERTHTGEKPYSCQVCNRSWRERASYYCHMKTHHPGMPLMYLKPLIKNQVVTVETAEEVVSTFNEDDFASHDL